MSTQQHSENSHLSCQPFVIAAMTADGFIARQASERSFDWTSQADKQWHVQKTKEAGCVIFGRTTFETFNKPLPHRLNLIYSRSQPEQLALQSNEDLSAAREAKTTQLFYTQLSPLEITQKLGKAGYKQLSVSGGASVYHHFLSSGVVSKLYLSYEPIVFGVGERLLSAKWEQQLELVQLHQLSDQTVALEFNVSNHQK